MLALTGQILEGVSKIGEAIEHLTGEPIGEILLERTSRATLTTAPRG